MDKLKEEVVPFYDEENDKSLIYQRKKCHKCKYYDGYDLCTHRLNFGAIEDDSVLKCKLLFLFSKDKNVKKD